MGTSMSRFVTDKYYGFMDTCYSIREGWRATKLIFNLARKLDPSNTSSENTPDEFLNVVKNTEDLPDSFKNMLSSIDSNTLKALLKVATQAFTTASNNENKPVNKDEVISNMVDVMAGSTTRDEIKQDEDVLNKLEDAARDHAKHLKDGDSKSKSSTTGDYNKNTKQKTQTEPSKGNSDKFSNKDDDGYIPSHTQKTILNMAKPKNENGSETEKKATSNSSGPFEKASFRTAREFQEYNKAQENRTKETESTDEAKPDGKNLPPLTKFLGEELKKRFGANWKSQIPPFMRNPNAGPIPDLGLGLDKQGNKDMVTNMAKIMKDLV